MKPVFIGRRKKRRYAVFVERKRFKVLRKRGDKKPIYFKDYRKASDFANRIKKRGGKAYVKKA